MVKRQNTMRTRNDTKTAAAPEKADESDDSSSELGFVISTEGTEEIPEASEADDDVGGGSGKDAAKDGLDGPPKKKRRRKGQKKRVGIYGKYDRTVESHLETFLFGKPQSEKPPIPLKEEQEDSGESSDDEGEDCKNRKAAWHDEDDDSTMVKDVVESFSKARGKHGKKAESSENYAESLRKQFKSLVDTPKWADLDFSKRVAADEDSDDEFFRETTDMLKGGKNDALKKGILEFVKVKDMNELTHKEGTIIKSAEFHPHSAVGLVAGSNGTASLFQIDGKVNPKIQTVNFQNFPIKTAHFTTDGKQFMVGSQHYGHFFTYDMIAGKTMKIAWKEGDGQGSVQKFEMSPDGELIAMLGRFGNIHFLSQKSKTKIFSLKMSDNVNSLAFSSGGDFLYSHGDGGEVYVWDVKAQECIHRFVDDGCIKGTAIAVSKSGRYLASGSDSGVVNIYDQTKILHKKLPKPEKVVLNLTTPITGLRFNPTSELLALCSEVRENAVKMVHLPSMSIYQNFPSLNFNLKRPNCMDFSLNGGFFSLGNNKGAANLFRLKSFCNY